MKIQIASDLHLDKNINHIGYMIEPVGDILCLAGDICELSSHKNFSLFTKFIEYECSSFKYVFHITGNHEYYSNFENPVSMTAVHNKLKNLQNDISNYIFLNNDTFTFTFKDQTYVIIGSTLWSMIPDEHINHINNHVYDYRMIYDSGVLLTPYDTIDMHLQSVQFIDETLKTLQTLNQNQNVILMTHHKPIWNYEINPNHDVSLKHAFESKCEWLLRPPLKLAIFGHTHEIIDTILNNVRIVSNAHGYENEMKYFDNSCIVEI